MPKIFRDFAIISLCATLAACVQPPTIEQQPSTEFAAQGLHPVSSSGFESAYVRPGANLPSYSAVDIQPLDAANVQFVRTAVPGTSRRDWEITPEREANLQAAWDRAMSRAFASYASADSGPATLRITAALTRIEPGRSSTTRSGAGGTPTMSSGDSVDISAEFRLYDAASGDLLAVIRDRRTAGLALWSRAAGADMINLFGAWAGLLHTRVSGR